MLASIFQGSDGKRRSPASRDADDYVELAWPLLRDSALAEFSRIFIGFDCGGERLFTPSHHKLNHLRIGIERRWAFRGIERSDAPTCACTDINKPSAAS